MTRIYLVRHGEASYNQPDYDQLSTRGQEQSERLGRHWARQSLLFDRVLVGPRRRHRETHDAVALEYSRAWLPWPNPLPAAGFDEYAGIEVMRRARPDLASAVVRGGAQALTDYAQAYREVTRRWARGDLLIPDLETWQQFRARVRRAIESLEGAGVVVAFTSAGSVAAAAALALGLDDIQTLELSYGVRNAAFAELALAGGRLSILSFNAQPHLETGVIA